MQIQTLSISKKHIITAVQFGGLLGIAVIAPLFHFQPVTGPIVNAVLFLGVLFLGAQNAILLGLLPSVIALSAGLLPAPLAPMIPFIMLSNTLLIVVFAQLKDKNFALAVISASILKFLFLFSTSFVVVNLIAKESIAHKAASILSWPQLLTALAGGLIAYILLKIIQRSKKYS